jgi:hypothetical protein
VGGLAMAEALITGRIPADGTGENTDAGYVST